MLLALTLVLMLSLPLVYRVLERLVARQWEQIAEQRARHTMEPSIERVTADLRRLRSQLEERENRPGTAGKGLKMAALRTAYVDVLGTACRQLDVRPPQRRGELPPPLAELYRVEFELRSRGLDVRGPERARRAA